MKLWRSEIRRSEIAAIGNRRVSLWCQSCYNSRQIAIANPMNIRQKVLMIIEQLPDEKLAILLNLALFLKSGKKPVPPMLESQAYQDWLSTENDIYDEIFADELTTVR
ncbi:MAG: hypothetical protein WBA89_19825 [Microcoleus sp.]|uniref:hypothetical protein n=1 Tax=Microcoleus sp. TaxID=44472 RepID=UPI003C71DB87